MARVLVGIPTRNRPLYVQETVHSVLAQTWSDFRVVVGDDASEVPVSETVAAFVRSLRDSRVSYRREPRRVGEYGQGRALFRECREDYFMILHDDDRIEPGYLEAAVRQLDEHPDLALFLANPYVFDGQGRRSETRTRWYLAEHGRRLFAEGPVAILEPLLRCGFVPISGTFFRAAALQASGFVDPGMEGNYPFEFNVLLRLGERGERAWFSRRELLGFRFHGGSCRSTEGPRYNESAVSGMLRLLEPRRFEGACERLRRKILAYTSRNQAVIRLGRGDTPGARRHAVRAVSLNPLSHRNWIYAALVLAVPSLLRPYFRRKLRPVGSTPAIAVLPR
jgi:glycosyltransferase involved in cell wall biosynthesis